MSVHMAAEFVRCPYTMKPLRGVDKRTCSGYRAVQIPVAVEDPLPRADACAHLDAAPHPRRQGMVGACRHPEAPWIVHTVRRMVTDANLQFTD
jgi:hypothetical protein